MSFTAVIPARKGSKGIPGKNRQMVRGRPLIVYTLEAAVGAARLDRILLSTDDEEVLEIARAYSRVECCPLRPPHLSDDTAKSADVAVHAVEIMGVGETKSVVLLQPTAPLRRSAHIDAAVAAFDSESGTFDSLASVVRVDEPHPLKVKRIIRGHLVPYIDGGDSERPRQELPPAYRLNGAIYIRDLTLLREQRSFFGKTMPFIMAEEDSVNIDTMNDLRMCELRLEQR